MSDAHLTDHECRLKMAAEGKAIYIPGKTDKQIKAKQAAKAEQMAQTSSRTVSLTNKDWDTLDTGISDVTEMLRDLGNVFSMLSYEEGLDRPEFWSVMRIAAKAVESMEGREILALDRLDLALRHASKEEQS